MEQRNIALRLNREKQNNALAGKEQNLLIGLIPSIQTGFFADSLETGVNLQELRGILATVLQSKQEASIIDMLSFLRDEGHRTAYSILLPFLLSSDDKNEVESTLRKRFFGIELFVNQVHQLYLSLDYMHEKNIVSIEKKDLERGILAWDMGELINLSRIAYETGQINEATAWKYIGFAGEECRKTFRSWEEVGKSFLIGQAMKLAEKVEEKDYIINSYLLATRGVKIAHGKRSFIPVNNIVEISFQSIPHIRSR